MLLTVKIISEGNGGQLIRVTSRFHSNLVLELHFFFCAKKILSFVFFIRNISFKENSPNDAKDIQNELCSLTKFWWVYC